MCFHSSVWAKGEGLEERLRAKKQPLGDLLSTLSSWGGGCSPIPPQIQGVAQVPFPTTCTDLWASNHCQMCPSLLLDFPSFPVPSFPSQLLQAYPPTQVSPPCPHPASGTPFGGRGWYVSSQLPARLSWESWEWEKGAGFICTY